MSKLGLNPDKRMMQLNEHLNPELQLDEGVEQGINKIINWVNKNVMKKFWTADQKTAERALTDKKVAKMYDEIVRDYSDIAKMIQSNIDRYKIEKALTKHGFQPDEIEPDGSGEDYNVAARMHTIIGMLKNHHREEKKKAKGDSDNYSAKRSKKKTAPK